MIRRRLAVLVLACCCLSVASTQVSPAWAVNGDAPSSQVGKYGSVGTDGVATQLVGNGFSPNLYQCVLYAAVSQDEVTNVQLESGIVRCVGKGLDGACADGHAYVERLSPDLNDPRMTDAACVSGDSFVNNSPYTVYVKKYDSNHWVGHAPGVAVYAANFYSGHGPRPILWGEAVSYDPYDQTVCPSPAKGTFNNFEAYNYASGNYSYVNSGQQHLVNLDQMAACWTLGTSSTVNGGFDVH